MKFTNYNFKIGWCFGLHTTAIREIGIKPEEGFVFVQYVLGLPNFLERCKNKTEQKTNSKNREYTKIRTFYRWYIVYVFKYIDVQIGYNVNLLNLFLKCRGQTLNIFISQASRYRPSNLVNQTLGYCCRALLDPAWEGILSCDRWISMVGRPTIIDPLFWGTTTQVNRSLTRLRKRTILVTWYSVKARQVKRRGHFL